MFGLPMINASATVSIGYQHVQARLALASHAVMALAQLGQGLLVIGGG